MVNGIIGKKVGMTQLFAPDGTVTPVTVIKAGPCVVVQKKSAAGADGYDAIQLGFVEERPVKLKNVNKPMRGHFEKTGGGIPPTRVLKEFRTDTSNNDVNVGDTIRVDQFADGDTIEVVGKSKGRGFAGTIKRHNFSRGPESHGSMNVRAPGSIGQSAYPSRVIKGTRSSGHMGDVRVTVKSLTVARVDAENNLLMVRGAVPGATGSVVLIKKSARQRVAKTATAAGKKK
ncbi:MAG: 50S ribosomal protein L3 [Pyrinomonadaceae bacterium MAG19_C2-C3]|nr:50S ribosomal protein L3 [Pyrinomonadaceae bacterium MAG19_C2-C3]